MRNAFICALWLLSYFSYSQNGVNGKITDPNNEPIEAAMIQIKALNGSTLAYTSSDEKGFYQIDFEEFGTYLIEIISMGFVTVNKKIELNAAKNEFNFKLTESTIELEDVVISITPAIRKQNDTIVYNAKSFLLGNETVVEDLLKRIPGLRVDDTGKIFAGDKEVSSVMLEGDDLLKHRYTYLTKSMPVKPIKEVELIDNHSKNKLLKGIENSDNVALNLKLEDDAKRIWFGNLSASYGVVSENQYELKGNLINVGKLNKFLFFSNLNNTGFDLAEGNTDYRYQDGELGDELFTRTIINTSNSRPNLSNSRVNRNNMENQNLVATFNPSKKLKIQLNTTINTDERRSDQTTYQQFKFNDAQFSIRENATANTALESYFGNLTATYELSNNAQFLFDSTILRNNEYERNRLVSNENPLLEQLNSKEFYVDQKINYTKRFQNESALVIDTRFKLNETPQNYYASPLFSESLFGEENEASHQLYQNKLSYFGAKVNWLKNTSKDHKFDFDFTLNRYVNKLDSELFLLQNNNWISAGETYKNTGIHRATEYFLNTNYLMKFTIFSIEFTNRFAHIRNDIEYIHREEKNDFTYAQPKVKFQWNPTSAHQLFASYSYKRTNTHLLDLADNYIQTGYRGFQKGYQHFEQLDSDQYSIGYRFKSHDQLFFFNANYSYHNLLDFISSSSLQSEQVFQSQKIILHDGKNSTIRATSDYFWYEIKHNFRLITSYSAARFKNQVNSETLRNIDTEQTQIEIILNSSFKSVFNYRLGSAWNYFMQKVDQELKNRDQKAFAEFTLNFTNKSYIKTKLDYYYFGILEKGSNTYTFLDFEAHYPLIENKLSIGLIGNNLLDTDYFRNLHISEMSTTETQNQLIGRYVLLKLEYRF